MMEIGGEYYSYDTTENVSKRIIEKYTLYALSGRSSIDFIVKDIVKFNKIKQAFLPSYCCDSMIIPFIKDGIQISFYDVYFAADGEISFDLSVLEGISDSIVLAMDYFGFDRQIVANVFSKIDNSAFKVEDMTHSWLTKENDIRADYWFASIRKWTRIGGLSILRKKEGFYGIPLNRSNPQFLQCRNDAANMKYDYINNGIGEKTKFLSLFERAESYLEENYKLCKADEKDIATYNKLDMDFIKTRRKRNASYLISEIKQIEHIDLIYDEVKENDCPLFVPVIVSSKIRDKLRNYLISENIYCPIHWPVSKHHTFNSDKTMEIYKKELSLLCDQRYNIEHMEYIISKIKMFMKRI